MENFNLDTTNCCLTVNVEPIVKIKTSMEIIGSGTSLPIEIVADFTGVSPLLHQTYLDLLKYQYMSDVSVIDSAGKETCPMTIEEEKSDWRLNRIADIFISAFKSR